MLSITNCGQKKKKTMKLISYFVKINFVLSYSIIIIFEVISI